MRNRKWKPKIYRILVASVLAVMCLNTVSAQQENDRELSRIGDFRNQEPDASFVQLRSLYARALEEKDEVAAGLALQQMGETCYHMGHYSKSLDFHLQAAALFKKMGDGLHLAYSLNDIGTLYYYNKQTGLARQQFDIALAIFKDHPVDPGIAITYGNIGHLYEKDQRYDSAFYFQRLALQHYRNTSNKSGMAGIYENIASIYEDLSRYDSSNYYYNTALNLYETSGDSLSTIAVLNNLGDILRKTGKYRESVQMTQQALARSIACNETYQLSAAYRDMAKAWHLLDKNDSAFFYQELSRKSLLDIYSRESNKQIAFLQVLNDIGKKNSEIERFKIEKRNTLVLIILAVAMTILLAILGVVTISRQHLKINNERLLREQNDRAYKTNNELLEIDLQKRQLQQEALKQHLDMKGKELSAHTLHIIQKNQLLKDLHATLEKMVKEDKRDQKKQLQQLIRQIDINFNQDQHWEEFRNIFEQVHESFFEKVRRICSELTANDLRLVALLKMNISSSDMATLLGISPDSLRVTRYRLRKKFNLENGENLSAFIQSLSQ
jgi:tetratricopeptide (TPR) repeat protein/DNA-binding CsgD family transcriptional regulator